MQGSSHSGWRRQASSGLRRDAEGWIPDAGPDAFAEVLPSSRRDRPA